MSLEKKKSQAWILALFLAVFPFLTQAAGIPDQTVYSTKGNYDLACAGCGGFLQQLGYGWEGTIENLTIRGNMVENFSSSHTIYIKLFSIDINDTGDMASYEAFDENPANYDTEVEEETFTYTGLSDTGDFFLTASTSGTVNIEPTRAYFLTFNDSGGSHLNTINLYGSTEDFFGWTVDSGAETAVSSYFFEWAGTGENVNSTRIVSFTPDDGETVSPGSVPFSLLIYVLPEDLAGVLGVKVSLHNIDQNVFLFSDFSPNSLYLFEEEVETSGFSEYSTSTPLANGNYRLEACLERSYFGGWLNNPFANLIVDEPDCQSHQFIVGTSTFIGAISQNGFSEFNDFVTGLSATTTEALAATCNPLGGSFGIRECLTYLFIPGGDALHTTINGLREGILIRVPWGYLTRFVSIVSNTATTTIPTFTTTIRYSESESTTLTFDPGDMIAGAGTLLESINDPIYGKTTRDVFEPIVQLLVALSVVFVILSDLTGGHGTHQTEKTNRKT